MKDNFYQLTTNIGEPVTEQAPSTNPAALGLPAGYLADGYHATTEKGGTYLRPEFVAAYAEQLAAALSPMKPSDFSGLLKELQRSKKRTLPFEARQTAAAELLPKSIALVRRNKAPAILTDIVKANIAAIHTDEDFMAALRHLSAIGAFLHEKGGDTQ